MALPPQFIKHAKGKAGAKGAAADKAKRMCDCAKNGGEPPKGKAGKSLPPWLNKKK